MPKNSTKLKPLGVKLATRIEGCRTILLSLVKHYLILFSNKIFVPVNFLWKLLHTRERQSRIMMSLEPQTFRLKGGDFATSPPQPCLTENHHQVQSKRSKMTVTCSLVHCWCRWSTALSSCTVCGCTHCCIDTCCPNYLTAPHTRTRNSRCLQTGWDHSSPR